LPSSRALPAFDRGPRIKAAGRPDVRVGEWSSRKAVALACDVTPRYCAADPETGGAQAVAETWRNLTAVGAQPLAITNCLNFGNPERPEIMGQFAGCVSGMGRAARALNFPVVSGNVSLYNETSGVAIPPTPGIGGVGLLPDLERMATIALKGEDAAIILLGETRGALGQTIYQAHATGAYDGGPPPVDLEAEQRVGDLVRGLIRDGITRTVHDVSDGGALVAAAEMALAGGIGVALDAGKRDIPAHAFWFGEDQARYLVAASEDAAQTIRGEAERVGVPARVIGRIAGDGLAQPGGPALPLPQLRHLHEGWFPSYLSKD
jgi:phosphoribosylformylglycinamidine synthase